MNILWIYSKYATTHLKCFFGISQFPYLIHTHKLESTWHTISGWESLFKAIVALIISLSLNPSVETIVNKINEFGKQLLKIIFTYSL